jgi:hypothetical protein
MFSAIMPRSKNQRTIKAFDADISLINERAKGLGCSAAEVIHAMCEKLRKDNYLQELGEAFDSFQSDATQLAEFKSQQERWDAAILEGLNHAN